MVYIWSSLSSPGRTLSLFYCFRNSFKEKDVQKALSANFLCDVDGAISMVSHGFANIDGFYLENIVRPSVAVWNWKYMYSSYSCMLCQYPFLVIKLRSNLLQSDDWTVPLLLVPRSTISDKPFTSLLLCSCVHSMVFTFERYTELWCQNLTLEVRVGTREGDHPHHLEIDYVGRE